MRIWPTKRFWKRLAIGLAMLVAVALIANGFMAWQTERRLQAKIAAIRAAGDPASIADLAPPPIPDEENVAAILERIRPRLTEFSKEHGRFYDSPIGKTYDEAGAEDKPAKEAIDTMRTILSTYADVEQGIAEAVAWEKYASRMDFTLDHAAFIGQMLDKVQNARTATRFLGWRNEVLLADGQHEEAIKNGIQALRLARLHENEPTLLAYLVSIAMRGIASEQLYDDLAAGQVSSELHAALDEELARHDNPQQFANVLKTERAVGAVWIDAQLSGLYAVPAHMIGWQLKSYQIGVLDAMDECVQLAARPWHEVREKFGPADGSTQPTGHGVLADLLVPGMRAGFEANARSLAMSRELRIYNALRAFAEKNGREATGLEELALPAEAVIDPYSGEPLLLKHTEDGWVIYSVMENGVDDGGDFKGLKDFGVAPPKRRLTE